MVEKPRDEDGLRLFIRELMAHSQEELIRAWTVQHENVVHQVSEGRYWASESRVPKHRATATQWMTTEMQRRGHPLQPSHAPIWMSLTALEPKKSPIWGTEGLSETMQMMELRIPKSRMLVSFHFPWSTRCLAGAAVFANKEDRRKHRELNGLVLPQEETRESWQKIFDLSLAERAETSAWVTNAKRNGLESKELLRLQATVAHLEKDDVVSVSHDW